MQDKMVTQYDVIVLSYHQPLQRSHIAHDHRRATSPSRAVVARRVIGRVSEHTVLPRNMYSGSAYNRCVLNMPQKLGGMLSRVRFI